MRTTTQTFKRIMASGSARKYLVKIDLTLADNTVLHLTEADIWDNTFKIETASSGTSSFDIGSAVIGKCSFSINNFDERFNQYDFFNASAVVWVGLVGDIDNNDTQVYYRMGFYTVDEPVYASSLITLELLDNMWKFDIPLSAVTLSYPITIRNAFVAICQYCGVTLGTQTFHGDSFTIEAAPEKDMNCREFLQYMAMIGCNFLTISDTGALLVKWYNTSAIPSGTDIDGGTFDTNTTPYSDGANLNGGTFAFNDGDTADGGTFTDNSDCVWFTRNMQATFGTDVITITGVKFTINDTAYTIGTAGYMLELENPIVNANNVNTVLNLIWDVLNGFSLRTYNITTISDLSAEVGDCCILKDYKGNFFYSWITLNSFGFSNHVVQCNAVTPQRQLTKRYSQTVSAAVEATRKQTEEIISDYDLAVQLMNDVAVNAMGGYEDYEDLPTGGRVYYLSNMPITKSGNTCSFQSGSTVFKRSGDGLFVSTNGGQTWQNGYNAQTGQLIVNVLNAIGISADWIKTGTLTVGGSGVGNPSIVVKDSSNNTVVDINQNGLTAHAGVIRTADNTFYVDMATNSVRIGAGTSIYDPNSKYSGSYVPTNSNYPASSWTDAEKANHIGETFTNTSTKKTYIYKVTPAAIPESNHPYGTNEDAYYRFDCPSGWSVAYLTFDSQCETEGSNYDYLDFYYMGYDGMYKSRLQGTSFAGKTYTISFFDSHTFYLHWHSDGSVTKWGWKFSVADSGSGTTIPDAQWESLPSASWTLINLASGGTYEWVESTITGYIDAKSGETSLTQEEVYNALTNNGQDQGLYLSGGKIYLNAQYMTSNAITIGGSQYSQKTYLQIRDSSNAIIGQWDKDGIEATAGKFGKLEIKKNASDVTYLRYINSVALIYTSQSWTGAIKANTGGMVKVNPYQEGWVGNGYVHILFNMNLKTSSSSARTDAQCRIDVLRFSGGVNQGIIKTVQLRYDGKDTSGSNGLSSGEEIVVIDEETGEVIADETSSSPGYFIELDGSYGSTDGDFYKIRYRLTQRSSSYVNSASISIDDNINGSGFMVKEKSDGRASASGRFAGEFSGSFGSFETLDLGVFKYGSNGWSDGLWKIKGDGTTYGEISESQFSLHNSEDFNNSSQGIMMQQGTLERRYNSNTYTPEWTSSDRRIKRDIEPLSVELSKDFIDGTEPKSFKYRNNTEKNYGMIAQEARELLDSLGETDSALEYSIGDTDIKDQRTIAYSQYIPHLINYVKDLRSEIDGLKAEIKALKGE